VRGLGGGVAGGDFRVSCMETGRFGVFRSAAGNNVRYGVPLVTGLTFVPRRTLSLPDTLV
jgi:hypothetical protein